jgi:putative Holliday junction resolvase
MGRILAIDYGSKRTEIAVTDEMQIIASGLTSVSTKNLIEFLKSYTSSEKVDLIVIGLPKQMNNELSESEPLILKFIKILNNKFPNMPVERVDERFTSKMAFQTMIASGINKNKRKNKSLVDEISATIILQSYLANK